MINERMVYFPNPELSSNPYKVNIKLMALHTTVSFVNQEARAATSSVTV